MKECSRHATIDCKTLIDTFGPTIPAKSTNILVVLVNVVSVRFGHVARLQEAGPGSVLDDGLEHLPGEVRTSLRAVTFAGANISWAWHVLKVISFKGAPERNPLKLFAVTSIVIGHKLEQIWSFCIFCFLKSVQSLYILTKKFLSRRASNLEHSDCLFLITIDSWRISEISASEVVM